MSTKIKICGLKSVKEIELAYKNGALWYGLVFYSQSPRNVTLEKAKYLVLNTPSSIKPVAITVDENIEKINEISKLGIKSIQLHGKEDVNFCKYLRRKYEFEIIKAISIANSEDLVSANKYHDIVDWILFDYKDKKIPGGSGKSFDWKFLKDQKLNYKWMLSGGLNHNNVLSALEITKAMAVDVSTGVEDKKGYKSKVLIRDFCNKVKNYTGI